MGRKPYRWPLLFSTIKNIVGSKGTGFYAVQKYKIFHMTGRIDHMLVLNPYSISYNQAFYS